MTTGAVIGPVPAIPAMQLFTIYVEVYNYTGVTEFIIYDKNHFYSTPLTPSFSFTIER